jgi:16S rRNA (guanine527-N7)-methyltransferase
VASLLEVLTESKHLGFLGPGAVEDHIEHAAAFAAAVPTPPARLLDLGSGGGVPGLVLAVTWGSTACTLLDAQLRRVRFLQDAAAALGIEGRVEVVHGRAEDLAREDAHRAASDVVSARSFGPPGITAECGAGFLVPGGCLVVSEPPDVEADRWPAAGLALLGLVDEGLVRGPTSAVRVLRSPAGPPDRVPRRAPAMSRTPAF